MLAAYVPVEWHGQSARVVGTIRDVTGAPLANARVAGIGVKWAPDGHSGRQETFETRSDSLGSYELEVPAGSEIVWVEHPNRFTFPEREWLVERSIEPGVHRADHQFHLYRVRGRVLGPDSLPVAKALVTYYADPGGSAICGTGLPQANVVNGSFEVLLQHRGPYIFWTTLSTNPLRPPGVGGKLQINADTTVIFQIGGMDPASH
jgi:hypothetical protein